MLKLRFMSIALLLSGGVVFTAPAIASSLLPGATITATPLSFAGSSCCLAPVQAGSVHNGAFSFDYTAYVFNGDTNSPFGTSAIDFAFKFSNTGSTAITAFDAFNFGSSLLNVGFMDALPLLMPQIDPNAISRSADGNIVTFKFGAPAVAGGSFSDVLLLQTNATSFTTGTFRLEGRDVHADVLGYVPVGSPVPEPSSLALFGTGLAGIASILRRRLAPSIDV